MASLAQRPIGAGGSTAIAKIAHVVGARPNFVKAAPVIRALESQGAHQSLVHTGQHYDPALSSVFFDELRMRPPDVQLRLDSSDRSPARQLGALLSGLELELAALRPQLVVLYGDVSSTLAGALVARGLAIPIAHIEAGLRSFDLSMPEEVNRRVTDMLSTLHFTTSPEAAENLATEGIDGPEVHHVGNPMIDTLTANLERLDPDAARVAHSLPARYAVATVHRQSNVDAEDDARRVVQALAAVARHVPVIVALHPRGRATLEAAGLGGIGGLRVVEPLGYLEFGSLMRGSALVVTDSGGVQEETTALNVPCLTLRANTERPITISHGTNRLVTAETIDPAVLDILGGRVVFPVARPPLWDGHAGERIAAVITDWLGAQQAPG